MEDLVDLPENPLVVGHPLVDGTNDPLLVYEKGDPPGAVKCLDLSARVDEKGKGEIQRLGETPVGLQIIGADTQYLGVAAFEGFDIPLKRRHLSRSPAGKILVVEGEKNVLLAQVVGKADGPHG